MVSQLEAGWRCGGCVPTRGARPARRRAPCRWAEQLVPASMLLMIGSTPSSAGSETPKRRSSKLMSGANPQRGRGSGRSAPASCRGPVAYTAWSTCGVLDSTASSSNRARAAASSSRSRSPGGPSVRRPSARCPVGPDVRAAVGVDERESYQARSVLPLISRVRWNLRSSVTCDADVLERGELRRDRRSRSRGWGAISCRLSRWPRKADVERPAVGDISRLRRYLAQFRQSEMFWREASKDAFARSTNARTLGVRKRLDGKTAWTGAFGHA